MILKREWRNFVEEYKTPDFEEIEDHEQVVEYSNNGLEGIRQLRAAFY